MASSSKKAAMTLYCDPNDIYGHRVRIVLAEKGINHDIVELGENTSDLAELAVFNPSLEMPTLVDRDLVLYKSEIIMEYLDERFPHPPLLPVYPIVKGRTRLMIYRINKDWYSLLPSLNSSDEATKKNAKKELYDSLLSVLPVFSEMPFFMSEDFSLLDCCILPLLWRLPNYGIELPSEASALLEYAKVNFKRDSFKASLTDAEKAYPALV